MQSRGVGVGLALPGVPHGKCGTKGAASRPRTAEGLEDIGVTRAVAILLFLMLCNKFADCGDKVMGNFHYGVVLFHECRFIFGHRFFRRLLLIVREDALNSVFVPSRGKSILVHIRLVRLRLR